MKIKQMLAATAGLSLLMVAAGCTSKTTHADNASRKTLTVVFLPSESSKEMTPVRTALAKVLHQATGKKISVQTTTDYNVAIQALASGKAQMGLLGPDSYIEARKQNSAVNPLVTYSGKSGTLKDAHYNSYVMVPKSQAAHYQIGGHYSLKTIKGKKISFVSATSTSGFAVPAGAIAAANGVKKTDLQQGNGFFDQVLYGQSHPGSAVNLFNGDVDVAAFDDIDLVNYGKFTNDATKAGAIFKINDDAPAPLDHAKGKASVAISVAQVQNEPLAINDKTVSKADRTKIIKALTARSTTANPLFFSKPDAKHPGLFTQTGKVHFMAISDKWYQPTHTVLGK